MTREQIEKIAVERFPPIEEIIDIHDINDDINRTSQRKAFIEGALMVVESYSDACQQCEGKQYIEVTDLDGGNRLRECPFCKK